MFEFHKDKKRYFNYQYWTARDYIYPFVEKELTNHPSLDVLEIGCAEAGVLKAFLEKGHRCVGIELSPTRTELAKKFHSEALEAGRISFTNRNIYDIEAEKDLSRKFDLIILKDVIEHIPAQEKLVPRLKEFLNPGGRIFFGFPPWWMPFGGHQQICSSKFLRVLPWFHLLPVSVYKAILKLFGEQERIVEELLEIKSTGINIERFEKIIVGSKMKIVKRKFFLTNPIYQYKFGIKPREQVSIISKAPYIRNFFTTAVYYLIG